MHVLCFLVQIIVVIVAAAEAATPWDEPKSTPQAQAHAVTKRPYTSGKPYTTVRPRIYADPYQGRHPDQPTKKPVPSVHKPKKPHTWHYAIRKSPLTERQKRKADTYNDVGNYPSQTKLNGSPHTTKKPYIGCCKKGKPQSSLYTTNSKAKPFNPKNTMLKDTPHTSNRPYTRSYTTGRPHTAVVLK